MLRSPDQCFSSRGRDGLLPSRHPDSGFHWHCRWTKFLVRTSKGLLFVLLSILTFTSALPVHALDSKNSNSIDSQSNPYGLSHLSGLPGAGPVPDLSLPRTVLSSIDNLIGAGGVIQTTPQNITLYNSAIILRLLGDPSPHD